LTAVLLTLITLLQAGPLPVGPQADFVEYTDSTRSGLNTVLALRSLPPDSLVPVRLALVGATVGGAVAGLYYYQRHAWWAAEHRGSFHFHDDGGTSLHLDKLGHLHATYFQSKVLARSLRWSGLSVESAALWGAVASWTVQLNVEVNDGFSELWGFDLKDLLANTLGAGYFYLGERTNALDALELKFSYWPSERIRGRAGRPEFGPLPGPVDDYAGHTYWLSVRPGGILPGRAGELWPDWLMLAGGVSGDRMYTPDARRAYYVSLDLDIRRLLAANTWAGAHAGELLGFIKPPAPAIRLSPRPTLYLIYYGQR
jgi:hypothetical protein